MITSLFCQIDLLQVLEVILRPLSVPDLLNCSLVNKKWRVAVGPVLQKHKKCFACVKDPCVDFVKLNDMMGRRSVKIINGLHIRIDTQKLCPANLNMESMRESFSHLLNWPFQYLHVENYYELRRNGCGTVIQLIQETFWASSESMKELAISFAGNVRNFFNCPGPLMEKVRNVHGQSEKKMCLFPNLRSVEILNGRFPSDPCFHSFVVELAPNLREIKGPVNLENLKFWSESAMRHLKCISIEPIEIDEEDFIDDNTLRKIAKAGPSLQVLKIKDYADADGNAPFSRCWFDPLAQILRSSRYTLNRLDFCASELMKIIRLEGYSDSTDKFMYFPNVKKLKLLVPMAYDPRVERSMLRRLSIGANFPKLKDLHVNYGRCHHIEPEGEEYEIDCEDCPPSDLGITLHLVTRFCAEDSVEYFVKTFPLLTSLYVDFVVFFQNYDHAYSFSDVFSCQHLKQLGFMFECGLYFDDHMQYFTLDAIFCGINFDEAWQLRLDWEQNGLELENLRIVPARPAITSAASNFILNSTTKCSMIPLFFLKFCYLHNKNWCSINHEN